MAQLSGEAHKRFNRATGTVYLDGKQQRQYAQVCYEAKKEAEKQGWQFVPKREGAYDEERWIACVFLCRTFAMPTTWSKKRKQERRGQRAHKKPDDNNLLGQLMDAFQGTLYENDVVWHTMCPIYRVWADRDVTGVRLVSMFPKEVAWNVKDTEVEGWHRQFAETAGLPAGSGGPRPGAGPRLWTPSREVVPGGGLLAPRA